MQRHPRFHLHFIRRRVPGSTWWNAGSEKLPTNDCAEATFGNVRVLIKAINDYIHNHNQNPRLSFGPRPRRKSCGKSPNVKKRWGHHTSALFRSKRYSYPGGQARTWQWIPFIRIVFLLDAGKSLKIIKEGHFESKSVDRLSSFHILASSNRARSFFSAPLYASLPSKSRKGGFCSCVKRTIA